MNNPSLKNLQTFIQAAEFKRIGNLAIRQAQAENHRLGLPNVYSKQGKLYFEWPNGDITQTVTHGWTSSDRDREDAGES
jgi:hypothetical protein